MLIFDPETSGGLLIAISADKSDALVRELQSRGDRACVVGEVVAGSGIVVTS